MPKKINDFCSMGFSFFFPVFTLFAPRPANSDYHITYRYLNGDNNLKNIEYNNKRSITNILWNPSLRYQKVIISAIRNMDEIRRNLRKKDIERKKINRIVFGSKSFELIKKVVLLDVKKNEDLKRGEFQIVIFKSFYEKNEVKFIPHLIHTFTI
ncbi:hypothetical protein MC378_12320 [Polaribacter sp. MSW13]|uniref:Uncharacterized protein n=1 Tax=Polaribacter marinus TaxID=2916838 RepID=A0A9X1VNT1_9FLAO|nr:hypothetical protein [Polaribacter marinus]MCI2229954.1 hypothetical protein [Polaribacter marinus]